MKYDSSAKIQVLVHLEQSQSDDAKWWSFIIRTKNKTNGIKIIEKRPVNLHQNLNVPKAISLCEYG